MGKPGKQALIGVGYLQPRNGSGMLQRDIQRTQDALNLLSVLCILSFRIRACGQRFENISQGTFDLPK